MRPSLPEADAAERRGRPPGRWCCPGERRPPACVRRWRRATGRAAAASRSHAPPRAAVPGQRGAARRGMKKILRPRSDPKTERSSDRVTWLLPMIWMEEEEAMRKRGSSRKKLRMPIASNTSPPIARTTAAAAAMRPTRLVGMSPRRTGTRRRARRKASSSRSSPSPLACSAGLRAALRSGCDLLRLFWRAPSMQPRGDKTAPSVHHPRTPLHGLLVSRFLPRPSQVVRFAIQTIAWFPRKCLGNFRES